jgi:tetratricopeptide (TPR) repeat protein
MRRSLIAALAIAAAVCVPAFAQITTPPSGDNQHSIVTQYIGLVRVSVDYNSPDVHAPNGEDRTGKIWGKLVPYGMINEDFGTCTECPWRAGANENTVFSVSHEVKIEGQPLPAGRYGLFMVAGPEEWTVIFSKNADSWGHYSYDPAEDQLRVKVKPAKSDYHEWLTYEFDDRKPEQATVALKWENLQVPFTIKVDNMTDLYLAQIRNELRNDTGFQWQNWASAAQYAMRAKRSKEAVEFADAAVNRGGIGVANFRTLSTLADAQDMAGMAAEAKATREKALAHSTATAIDLHQYARQQLQKGNKEEAMRVWEMNAKRFPNQWPVNVGLARGYSAMGKYKDALKYAKLALAQAPDEQNKKSIEEGIRKLEAGKDWNS